jgi:hypothetical protein
MYPAFSFTLALMALVIVALCVRSPNPFIKAAMLLMLLPVLPIIAVRCLAVFTIDLCDWITVGSGNGRMWCQPSVFAARWFESKLQS